MQAAFSKLPSACLANQLLRRLPAPGHGRATLSAICRHDLLQTTAGDWRLVESNSIAAGMGPFSEALQDLLQSRAKPATTAVANPATQLQAAQLYQSACASGSTRQPLIVFAVEAQEDNVFDQRKLGDALRHMGARVVYQTLAALVTTTTVNARHRLVLAQHGEVDALYFRTGYNLADYGTTQARQQQRLDWRGQLERLNIALCPTISYQLASHKWLQAQLSQLSPEALGSQFQLPRGQALAAQRALATPHRVPCTFGQVAQAIASGEWLWKSLNEGGGNILQARTSGHSSALNATLLMKKIDAVARPTPVVKFDTHTVSIIPEAISELGIFTLGDDQHYGGYLLRTKARQTPESGVHKGFGFIDTVRIQAP
jgi:glutathione synthase